MEAWRYAIDDKIKYSINRRPRGKLAKEQLGLKTKTKNFDYRELFSRFYRDSGVNENENGYRKYKNENGIFIWNWKRKRFQAKTISASIDRFRKLPYLFGNLPLVLLYLKPSPTHAFRAQQLAGFLAGRAYQADPNPSLSLNLVNDHVWLCHVCCVQLCAILSCMLLCVSYHGLVRYLD